MVAFVGKLLGERLLELVVGADDAQPVALEELLGTRHTPAIIIHCDCSYGYFISRRIGLRSVRRHVVVILRAVLLYLGALGSHVWTNKHSLSLVR